VQEPQDFNPVSPLGAQPVIGAKFQVSPPTLLVPEYAAPLQAELTDNQHLLTKVAACFGAFPLTLGILDFLLWIPTRAPVFEMGGVLIIYLGLACTFIGGLLLLIQLCSIRGSGKLRLFFKTSRFAIFLILANYPIALGIVFLVSLMGFRI